MKRLVQTQGAALIVVLSILVLVSGLVVGMAMAMRKERSASFYHLERLRADLLARQGADYGQALLSTATTKDRFWVSGPGHILATPPASFEGVTNLIDLSSGVTGVVGSNTAADLNRHGWSGGDRLLDPSGGSFGVQWIYVLKDGTYRTTSTIDTNVVGRFAFWIDDESARVDISTAHERTAVPTRWADPAQIQMSALQDLTAGSVNAIVSQAAFGAFSTPYEALAMTNSGLAAALSTNRFSITHYTQDPDMNPWGENRILLTTLADRAFRRIDYIDILADSTNNTPGLLSSLEETKVNVAFEKIMKGLTRTNWPYVLDPAASWAKKYGTNGAGQLALDIVEYVRATESTNTFIEPLTATLTGTNLAYAPTKTFASLATGDLIGTTRRPLISEMGVWVDATNNAGVFAGKLFLEVYMPAGYGVSPTNLPPVFIASDLTGNAPLAAVAMPTTNQFVRLEQNISITNATRPTNVMLRVGLFKAAADTAANILDVAPLAATDKINYAIDATNVAEDLVNSWEVRDPRVNKFLASWEHHAPTNTMFPPAVNSQWSVLIAPPTGLPGADRVTGAPNSAMSDVSVQMAANGRVGSVGELGFINTGVAANMPWRSVRLQPDPNTRTNIVPDWALMDLFSAPVPQTNLIPGINLVAGRINLNALISGTNMVRTNVLTALFTNTAVPNVRAAVTNVMAAGTLADTGGSSGVAFGNLTNYKTYPSVGQLAEIKGIADSGEASEQVIRQVASLATVRGNVFSVYSVGQALQVSKTGKVSINGEKMVRSIVERTLDASGNPQYKVIYWSEIYP